MADTSELQELEEGAIQRLRELLDDDLAVLSIHLAAGPDMVVSSASHRFAVEVKSQTNPALLSAAIEQLRHYQRQRSDDVPLLATRYMSELGKVLCKERGVGWFDLSGNADIKAPGLRILIEGKPNQFKRPGRPSTAFAPKASRITRWLLMYLDKDWSQKELCDWTQIDKGYASKVLSRLRGQALLQLRDGRYHVRDPDLLLKAWQAQYDFSKHRIIKGTIAARNGQEATERLAATLRAHQIDYAVTGLAGAWYTDKFAQFRLSSVYLRQAPSPELLTELSFRQSERGANVWLIVPKDVGVFHGLEEQEGILCVHPIQIYLDLMVHPERAQEAAEHLRSAHLNWRGRGE